MLALDADGGLQVGGKFSTTGGHGSSAINWSRSGSAPELAQLPAVSDSFNGDSHASIGTERSKLGEWHLYGYEPPQATWSYLLTSAPAASGVYGASSSSIRSTRRFFLIGNDGIFTDGFRP